MMDPTQIHRRLARGGALAGTDLITSPPSSNKHALEHDPPPWLPQPKKLRGDQADTTEVKTEGERPLVQATPKQRYHESTTLEAAGIGYNETNWHSFVANKHFFARISKDDVDLRSEETAPSEYYNLKLSANDLGKNGIFSVD